MVKKHLFFVQFFLVYLVQAQILFDESAINHGLIGTYGIGFAGGGISFIDFDNDGWDDVTLGTEENEHILFFKNNQGIFSQVFPNIIDDIGEHKQLTWVDFDNDGDKDLYVAGYNYPNQLYRNDGDFSFTNIIAQSGLLLLNQKNFGAAWGDYNNDGFLDVFLSVRDLDQPNRLYKNNGDGTFTETSSIAGISQEGHLSFCASFIDYDKDGFQDIYVANDRFVTTNIMYRNNGDGSFTDVSIDTGTGILMEGMSTTIGDYNNDGWMDIYITNTNTLYEGAAIGNVLLENNGDGTFTNVAQETGTQFNSLAWGAVFLDAENDRDLDLYVSCMLSGPEPLPSAFYENLGSGIFSIPETAGFQNDTFESYSNAIGDVDNDGFPDIIVCNEMSNMLLWKNLSGLFSNNNWLKVNLQGVQSNRDGIGSFIEVNTNSGSIYRYVVSGEGYISQNSTTELFGLGADNEINYVKVKWLSGIEDTVYNVVPNQKIDIVEGASLSINEIEKDNLKIYPNPVNNTLSINAQSNIDRIAIYNILSQVVMTSRPQDLSARIDISNLEKGPYVIHVSISNTTKTFKILKN